MQHKSAYHFLYHINKTCHRDPYVNNHSLKAIKFTSMFLFVYVHIIIFNCTSLNLMKKYLNRECNEIRNERCNDYLIETYSKLAKLELSGSVMAFNDYRLVLNNF